MFRHNRSAFKFQIPIYVDARDFVDALGIESVFDIGCGNPQKLKAYILPAIDDIVGCDLPEVVEQIDDPFGEWIGTDLNDGTIDLGRIFGLIISADVIEHLKNPTMLFDVIKKHADESTIILISTPEKASVTISNHDHVTEYTKDEMITLIKQNGLSVDQTKSYLERCTNPVYTNNMFLCKRKYDESDNKL